MSPVHEREQRPTWASDDWDEDLELEAPRITPGKRTLTSRLRAPRRFSRPRVVQLQRGGATTPHITHQVIVNIVELAPHLDGGASADASPYDVAGALAAANAIYNPVGLRVLQGTRQVVRGSNAGNLLRTEECREADERHRYAESGLPGNDSAATRRAEEGCVDGEGVDVEEGFSSQPADHQARPRASREVLEIMRQYGSPGQLTGYFVPSHNVPDRDGQAVDDSYYGNLQGREGFFVTAGAGANVFAHELGHVLMRIGHTDLDGSDDNGNGVADEPVVDTADDNLMQAGDRRTGQNLTPQQVAALRASRYVTRVASAGAGSGAGTVQRSAAGAPAESVDPHAVARRGAGGRPERLPHLDLIQRAFGLHNISDIHAHTGPDAAAASRALGERAYALGDNVVLGSGVDLHTVAHEAAHVVQQRSDIQLAGGFGEAGDRYEQHADRVADAVVRGDSAQSLLDELAGGDGTASTALQLDNERSASAGSDCHMVEAAIDTAIDRRATQRLANWDSSRPDAAPECGPMGQMVQQKRLSGAEASAADDHLVAAATAGAQGPANALPHLARIQSSFGRHDVSGVRAFTGEAARTANAEIGSRAYASGNDVVFGAGAETNLHTAAHEAAHVVQQRAGVSLAGRVGTPGDRYEQHADAVADRVVRGESAEGLLDRYAGAMTPAGGAPVQLDDHISTELRQSRGLVYRVLHQVRDGNDVEGARRLARVFEVAAQRDGHVVFDYRGEHYDITPSVATARRAANDLSELSGGTATCGPAEAGGPASDSGAPSPAPDSRAADAEGEATSRGDVAALDTVNRSLQRDVRINSHVDATVEYLAPGIRALLPADDDDLPDYVKTALVSYRNAANALARATRAAVAHLLQRGGRVAASEVEQATRTQRAALDEPRTALHAALTRWLRDCGREGRNPNALPERNTARRQLRRHTPRGAGASLARLAFTAAAIERLEHGVGSDAQPPTPRVRRLEELGNEVMRGRVLPRAYASTRVSVTCAAEGTARQQQLRELRSQRDQLRQQLRETDATTADRLDTWERAAHQVDEGGDVGNAPPEAAAARHGVELLQGDAWTQQYEADGWRARIGGRNISLRPRDRASVTRPGGFYEGGNVGLSDEAIHGAANETGAAVGDPEQARRAEQILRIIDDHEGGVDAVNTWDNQTLTLPMGLSRAGRFQRVLANLAGDQEDPGAFQRLFGQYGISVRVNSHDPSRSVVRIRVRSARPDAPLPVREDGSSFTPGQVLENDAAHDYWSRDPLLCMRARAAAADPAYQRATAREVARSAETSLDTRLGAGDELGPQPLREILAQADRPLVDACFAALADLAHGMRSAYNAAVDQLNERFSQMLHERADAGEEPYPLPASQQNELARLPVQRTLDRGKGGGPRRAAMYQHHIEGLNLEASGVTVRRARQRRRRGH